MEINEMIEVLTAFKEGKKIEYRSRLVDENFIDSNAPTWNFGTTEYRIKPQPEYIPFTWEDRHLFRDKWVKKKRSNSEYRIIQSEEGWVHIGVGSSLCYSTAFELLLFIDGTPFGKLKP